MIGTLPVELKQNWQDHVNTLVHAYNCMESTTTKYSPYYLMFGREPNLPIDIEFGVRMPDLIATSTQNYVEIVREKIGMGILKRLKKSMKKKRKETKGTMTRKLDVPN